MQTINVTALAQAAIAIDPTTHRKAIQPQLLNNEMYFPYWMQGRMIALSPYDFLDDATSATIAKILGGEVIKLFPFGVWQMGVPNTTNGTSTPLANFIAWPTGNGKEMQIIPAAWIGCQMMQSWAVYGFDLLQSMEIGLALTIPGSVPSPEVAALMTPDNQYYAQTFAGWYVFPIILYTPA